MTKIIFWNAEHLTDNAFDIYENARLQVGACKRSAQNQFERRAGRGPTKRITRAMKAEARGGVGKRKLDRDTALEVDALVAEEVAERAAERKRNKFQLSNDLPASARHVFMCEVSATVMGAHNPLTGPANGATLHYAYYQGGNITPFTDCPVTHGAGWYVHPAGAVPFGADFRVPKSVTIPNGGAGAGVRFCFWHAPSGNSGAIVAQMYNSLAAAGQPFVLFGDLNAEPNQLMHHGIAAANIIDPGVPTRISGRTLDYAVSNVAAHFTRLAPLHPDAHGYDIKQQTGSDHMPMIMHYK